MASLEAEIAAGRIDPVLILVGDDPLLIGRVVRAVRDAVVPENVRGFNFDQLEGRGLLAEQVLGAAQTMPMMADRRLVLVRDFQAVSPGEVKKLAGYLSDPAPATVLLCVATKVDKRVKFFSTAKKSGYLRELTAPKDASGFVADECRDQGVELSSAAQRRLVQVLGNDLARISVSVGQLGLYAGSRRVEVDDVDALVADTRERSIFELIDAIGAGDADRATSSVSSLCDQRQSAIGVIVMMARHWRQMAKCVALRNSRLSGGELARELGVPPFVATKLANQARTLSPASVARGLTSLAAADRDLKGLTHVAKTLGRPLAERVLLERLAQRLVALGRG